MPLTSSPHAAGVNGPIDLNVYLKNSPVDLNVFIWKTDAPHTMHPSALKRPYAVTTVHVLAFHF